jgi:prepilin-type N-terminal cleavage/methylation domain-containing protein
MKHIHSQNKGFTLIEILVSVAIFSVVMVVALGALLAMSVADRKAEAIKTATDNLNFALDSMSRAIRTGYSYHCGSSGAYDCTNGSNIFYFTSASGVQTAYQFDSSCGGVAGVRCIDRQTYNGISWSAWEPITATDITLTDFSGCGTSGPCLFYVRGSQPGSLDNMQPLVTITVSGSIPVSSTQTSTFYLQTSVAQRIYDQ